MKKKVCIISLSQIAQDGRVLRQIEFLSREYRAIVVGYGFPPTGMKDRSDIEWITLPLRKKYAGTLQRLWERFVIIPFFPKVHPAYRVLVNCDCDVIHVNNWDSLPMAAQVARQRKVKIVLDLHESYDSWYWGLNAGLIKFVFRKYAKNASASTTVVKELVNLHQKFGLNPVVVMNVPSLPVIQTPQKKTDPNKIWLIHHGIATHARRTELMIQTIALCDPRYELHLVLTNYNSKYANKLKKLADDIAPGRVYFYPPYPANKIVEEISKFDVGFFPLPPTNYNYLIALPNKLFEFIAAGLAVCIGPSVNMAEIVGKYGCGVIAPSFDPHDLSKSLNDMTDTRWDELKSASRDAAKELNAENEIGKVLKIYRELLGE
jgi:glycosyltransferase involved in cell wall biosynthesis